MTRMAVRARHRGVLGYLFLQQVVSLLVATCAKGRLCGLIIDHLRRLVDGMAHHTVFWSHLHRRAVGFMARAAFRNISVLVGMTVRTSYIASMLAREVLYFARLFRVAKDAGCLYF